jgi:hypothetical protein
MIDIVLLFLRLELRVLSMLFPDGWFVYRRVGREHGSKGHTALQAISRTYRV